MSNLLLRSAFAEHQRGNLKKAARLYDEVLRHLEAAVTTMWERAERGLPPQSFAVPA